MGECKHAVGRIGGAVETTCIDAVSIKNPELADLKKLQNGKREICLPEIKEWFYDKYNSLWPKAVFSVCEEFDKQKAIEALHDLRLTMSDEIDRTVEEIYGSCLPETETHIANSIKAHIEAVENSLIEYALDAAEERGAGQLGFSWEITTGKIVHIRPDSDGAKGGLKVGDKIISIDGFEYEDTLDYAMHGSYNIFRLGFWLKFLVPEDGKSYETLTKHGALWNQLCFGPCGSIATVVVERDGKEMTLKIKRGKG